MNTQVNKSLCIGCELCTEIAPSIYMMDDDELAVASQDDLSPEMSELAIEAAESCPVDAIIVN